jgi:diguanylate cyclase (GGDEF)-like protein
MQEILERCIELDTAAQKTYAKLATICSDPELARTFQRMSTEEKGHVRWWTELRDAYAEGRLPTLPGETDLLDAINQTANEVKILLETDLTTLSTDNMLEMAIRMEFFMLDPAFGELIEMLDPGPTSHHRDSYSNHVMRLVHEIEKRHSDRSLASFLARVLTRTYRDQERLSALATRDPLTGLYNRRGFYSSLTQWCSLSQRYGHSLGVLVVDVDHFKDVNDTYGHPTGDDVLCAIANALQEAVRAADVVARYGGDEFAVLAPNTSAKALQTLADRVLSHVHRLRYAENGREIDLTVSVGGAFVADGQAATPEALLSGADESLYEAKREGRDCSGAFVEVAQEAPADEDAAEA